MILILKEFTSFMAVMGMIVLKLNCIGLMLNGICEYFIFLNNAVLMILSMASRQCAVIIY